MPETLQQESFTLNRLAELLGHDRRSLKDWLVGVEPANVVNGHPTYRLSDVQVAVKKHLNLKKKSSSVRDRLLGLQCEKIAAHIAIIRKEWVPVADVEAWGGELGAAIRQVVCQIHLCATSVVGMTVAEAEVRLKEVEDEILSNLGSLQERMEAANAAMVKASEEAPSDSFTITDHDAVSV